MKEPNIGNPTEDGIRAHFGKALPAEMPIEQIPHTRVWATAEGVLLWDPKNGYADITAKPYTPYSGNMIPMEQIVKKVQLETLIFLNDSATELDRATLVISLENAGHLYAKKFIGFTNLTHAIKRNWEFKQIVVVSPEYGGNGFNVENALRIFARERKLNFLSINLK